MFRYGPGEQIFRIQPNRVLASSTFTTLEWTIRSVTGGAGLDAASSPPFAEPDTAGAEPADPVTASGPVLVVATGQGEPNPADADGEVRRADPRTRECLCSPLQGWTSVLRRPDKAVTVVTTYPPLPAGTDRVQVRFGGLGTIVGAGHAGVERAQPSRRNAPVVADDLAARRRAFRAWRGRPKTGRRQSRPPTNCPTVDGWSILRRLRRRIDHLSALKFGYPPFRPMPARERCDRP